MKCVAYSKKTPCIYYMDRVGLKEQNDRIRMFASDNDLKITKFYEDKSDDYLSDSGFEELRRDGMKRQFDLIVFESLYRFAVTIAESRNLLLHTFFLIGINFIIIEDGIDSRKEDYQSLEKYFEEKKWEISGRLAWAAKSNGEYKAIAKKEPVHLDLSDEDRLFRTIRRKCSYTDPKRRLCICKCGERIEKTTFICLSDEYRELVTRDELMDAVLRAIRRERKMCINVYNRIDTTEAEEYMDTVETSCRIRAKTLFEESVEAQKDNIKNYLLFQNGSKTEQEYLDYHEFMFIRIQELSDEFIELTKRLEYRRKQFSKDNEWIKRFMNINVNEIDSDTIKKILMSVVIKEDGSMEVKLNTKGKDVFPRKWFFLRGDGYGT